MKILIVLPRFPYPLEKGDKLRAFHQIEYLSKNNDIYLFCVSHISVPQEWVEKLRPYCREIRIAHPCKLVSYKNVLRNFLHSKSLQLGYWDSSKARRMCRAFEQEVQPDVIYNQMVRTIPLIARSCRPKVMDFQDALSMNTERRMDSVRRGFWHWVLHFEFKMLRSTEYNSFKIFDDLVIISDVDSEAIPHHKNGTIKVVPNGVDFDFFKPMPEVETRYDIVFCGNMQYSPNVNAAKYLANEVMPLVWKRIPEATLLISGASPKSSVRKLASPNVTVSGWVNDIRDSYASSKVFAAPMNMGSGLQNKLLEAMSMGLPCISTTIANSALGATVGDQILVADDPQSFADQIVLLLSDEDVRNRVAKGGSDFVHHHFDWNVFGEKLEVILQQAASKGVGK